MPFTILHNDLGTCHHFLYLRWASISSHPQQRPLGSHWWSSSLTGSQPPSGLNTSWPFPSERCFPVPRNEPCLACSPWPWLLCPSSISTFTQALHITAAKLGLQSPLFPNFLIISVESSASLWLHFHLCADGSPVSISSPCSSHAAATTALQESQNNLP